MSTNVNNAKNALKEGRKKAQELASLYKQSGNKYFIVSSEESNGDLDSCKAFMQGLNENKVIKTLSKCVFTTNDDILIGLMHLSEDKENNSSNFTIDEWMKSFVDEYKYLSIEKKDENTGVISFDASANNPTISCTEVFPFKLKDELLQHGIRELKKLGLIASSNDDSDEEIDYAAEMGIEW